MAKFSRSVACAVSGFGAGATLGGGIAGLMVGGIGASIGILIGGGVGALTGAAAASFVDRPEVVFTQGQAREYMVSMRRRYPDLELSTIVAVTEYVQGGAMDGIYMFLSDNVVKCTKRDVDAWLAEQSWRQAAAN